MSEPAVAPKPLTARLRGWLLDAALLIAVLVAAHVVFTRHVAHGVAPAFAGTTTDGAPISLASLRGKPTLVQFWATWCPVCHQEDGAIASLATDHQVITVAEDSGGAPNVAGYLTSKNLRFPAIADETGAIGRAFGVDRYPTSFILDASGNVRFVEVGYTTAIGLRLRLWLAGF
ncbi:MAG: protein disulfide oxidoreductase [Deltaproteobacteria bacterium]|nr:protein disulfide oxidoreductase [Deltaproteobacteria bacterium]